MDNDFITEGLESNRYLRAYHLVTRFESTINKELEATCQAVRETHPGLFDLEQKPTTRGYDSQTLRTLRTEAEMTKQNDEGNNLTINIGLEWLKHTEQPQGEPTVTEDMLCYVLYKIKYGSERAFETVKEATREDDRWIELRFGKEQYDTPPKVAPGIAYRPVEVGQDVSDGLALLGDHFTEVYAPLLQD